MSGRPPLRVALDVSQIDNQSLGSGQFRYGVDLATGLCALDGLVDLTLLGSTARPVPEFRSAIARFPERARYAALPPHHGRGSYYRDIARLSWWLGTHLF